ncbi:MAG: mitochondrial inner membrane protein required for protein import [Bathelium mastoideum]|nr:MAG: mitochondrial inner membrane protein required for protein import [Bathelium mastoideum]
MLTHAAARALAGRTAPASLRISPLPLLTRNYAKDARPANARRTPLRDQRKVQSDSTRFGGFGGAVTARKQNNQDAAQEVDSRATAELDENATPTRNTAPQTQSVGKGRTWKEGDPIKFAIAGAATSASSPTTSRASSESVKQDVQSRETAEFDPAAAPARNTEPSAQPGPDVLKNQSASRDPGTPYSTTQEEFSSPKQPEANTEPSQQPSEPLPDLRQGIPSTFAAEYLKKAENGSEGKQGLDITESKESEDPASSEGAGRGGDRELPRSAYESSVDRRRNNVAYYAYLILATFGLTGAVYFGRDWANEEEERRHPDAPSGWSLSLMWKRIKARLSGQVSYYTEPAFQKLLPDMDPAMRPPMTLVLSLEDLLIHSEWTREHGWRMAKRPGLDYFLRYLSQYYELAIFTTVPSQSGIPVINKLDPFHVVLWYLFREATRYENGEYIKDLSYLNRDLSKTIIIDTNASHVRQQPENAIVLPPWTGSSTDHELVSLIPFLEYVATMSIPDVRPALASFQGTHIPTEFARRETAARKEFETRLAEERARRPRVSGWASLGQALGIRAEPAPGGLVLGEGGESVAQGLERGKMLSDQIRERGQREYERMEREIRENGDKWLKEMAAEEKKAQEEQMKSMRSGAMNWFGMGRKNEEEGSGGGTGVAAGTK